MFEPFLKFIIIAVKFICYQQRILKLVALFISFYFSGLLMHNYNSKKLLKLYFLNIQFFWKFWNK